MASAFDLIKNILLLSERQKDLTNTTSNIVEKLHNMDKRLVRLETMVEIASNRQSDGAGRQKKIE